MRYGIVEVEKIYINESYHLGGAHMINYTNLDHKEFTYVGRYYYLYLWCLNNHYEIVDGKMLVNFDKCIDDLKNQIKKTQLDRLNDKSIITSLSTRSLLSLYEGKFRFLLCFSGNAWAWVKFDGMGDNFNFKFFGDDNGKTKEYSISEWIIKGLLE